MKALKQGLQALLRDRMVELYQTAKDRGYTSLQEKANLDNLYINYHALGLNGVMDAVHEEYMNMEVHNEDHDN